MRIGKRDNQDKRTGRKQVVERVTMRDEGVPSLSLEDAVEFVMKIKRANNLKEKTLRGYRQNMSYFIEWLTDPERYGEVDTSDVTAEMLREYVLWCANEKVFYEGHPFKAESESGRCGLSAASVNVRIRVLRTFFNVLYEEEVIQRNPAARLSLMRQDVDTVEPLTEDELRRLLKVPDQRFYAQFRDYIIMVLIIDSGLRLGEICALEITDVNFLTKQITLPAIKNKNRKSRVLPLSNETVRLLKQVIAEVAQHFPDNKFVFTTNYGEQLSDKTVQKAITKYAEAAKIERPVSPHRLRHNFATMAALNGMDIFTLMKMMGHSDISTTRKYVQVSTENLAEQHKRYSPLSNVLKKNVRS